MSSNHTFTLYLFRKSYRFARFLCELAQLEPPTPALPVADADVDNELTKRKASHFG
jgi:hypothetical protein